MKNIDEKQFESLKLRYIDAFEKLNKFKPFLVKFSNGSVWLRTVEKNLQSKLTIIQFTKIIEKMENQLPPNYFNILDDLWKDHNAFMFHSEDNYEDLTKLEWLSSQIFEFTCYDGEIIPYLAQKMVEVLEVIVEKKQNEYLESLDNLRNYYLMINMPFLKDKLEWGVSVESAWFDQDERFNSAYKLYCERLSVPIINFGDFITQLISWSKI